MIEILENIKGIVEVLIAVLSLVFVFVLAPQEALSWLKKLLLLSIFLQIVGLFVPSLEGIKIVILWLMSFTFYQLFPASFWALFSQALVMVLTYNIFRWTFNTKHTANVSEEGTGFTSRRV